MDNIIKLKIVMDKDYFRNGFFKGTFEEVWSAINILRRECPWDREQTVDSVKFKLVEESYETIDAYNSGKFQDMISEIGDIILVVLFIVKIMEDEGRFTLEDVFKKLVEKLVRRHPHVFGEKKLETAGEVLKNWESMKDEEKKRGNKESNDDKEFGINMPSLYLAYRISERRKHKGRISLQDIDKVRSEARELFEKFIGGDLDDVGNFLFLISQICALYGVNPEEKLREKIRLEKLSSLKVF